MNGSLGRGPLGVVVVLCAALGIFAVAGRVMFPDSFAAKMEPVRNTWFEALGRADAPGSDRPLFVRAVDAKFGATRTLTLLHIVPGALFMLLAPFQLIKTIRSRWPTVHRWNGRVAVTAGLVSVVPGLYFGLLVPVSGRIEAAIVAAVGALFLVALWKAVAAIRRRDIAAHREWMLRAFAVAFAISVVRFVAAALDLWLSPSGVATPVIFLSSLAIGWGASIGVAEWWIRGDTAKCRASGTAGVIWALVTLLAQFAPPVQGSCPNLSGRYVLAGADGHVVILISQSRCTSIRIDWSVFAPGVTYRTQHQLALDGRDQPDTAWFRGTGYQITSAKYAGRVLELTGKSIAESDTGVFMWTGRMAPHAGGDLCVGFQVQPTKVWGNTAARVEGGEAAAEQRAASRSAKPCPAR